MYTIMSVVSLCKFRVGVDDSKGFFTVAPRTKMIIQYQHRLVHRRGSRCDSVSYASNDYLDLVTVIYLMDELIIFAA